MGAKVSVEEEGAALRKAVRWYGQGDEFRAVLARAAKLDTSERSALVDSRGSEDEERGATALLLAVQAGNIEAVQILIEEGGADPDLPNSAGRTPLMVAAFGAKLSCLRLLLAQVKGDVAGQTDRWGNNAAHNAAEAGKFECISMMARGLPPATTRALLEAKNNDGQTPVELFARQRPHASDLQRSLDGLLEDAKGHSMIPVKSARKTGAAAGRESSSDSGGS
jgi:Ankyrin repeats (3 copies)